MAAKEEAILSVTAEITLGEHAVTSKAVGDTQVALAPGKPQKVSCYKEDAAKLLYDVIKALIDEVPSGVLENDLVLLELHYNVSLKSAAGHEYDFFARNDFSVKSHSIDSLLPAKITRDFLDRVVFCCIIDGKQCPTYKPICSSTSLIPKSPQSEGSNKELPTGKIEVNLEGAITCEAPNGQKMGFEIPSVVAAFEEGATTKPFGYCYKQCISILLDRITSVYLENYPTHIQDRPAFTKMTICILFSKPDPSVDDGVELLYREIGDPGGLLMPLGDMAHIPEFVYDELDENCHSRCLLRNFRCNIEAD